MGNGQKSHHHSKTRLTDSPPPSLFLPMFCSRSSFRDISWPGSNDNGGDDVDDPLSPKVGCMGQVKRNNRVVGFPTPGSSRFFPVSAKAGAKRSKLKRMFSDKGLVSASVSMPATTPAVSSCRVAGRSARTTGSKRIISCEKEKAGTVAVVSVVDMDPPLPVTRRAGKGGNGDRDGDSLWKRRSGGIGLKRLELQKIHHQGHHHHHVQSVTV